MKVTPRPGRPRDTSIDDAILACAAERLSRHGYEGMTIDDVARDAGVTRPTVYRRWPSKDALGIAAVASLIQSTDHEPTGDVRQDLLDQATQLLSRWSGNQYLGLLGAAIVERENHREIYDYLIERLIQPRREALRAILQRGIDLGSVRPDIDVEVVVGMFVGSFYAIAMAEDWNKTDNWAERLTDSIMQLINLPGARLGNQDKERVHV